MIEGGDEGGTDSDVRPDRADADAGTCEAGSGKINGQACACAGDCASGFCVDGVCCNTACTEGCMTCTAEESVGVMRRHQAGRQAAHRQHLRRRCRRRTAGWTARATARAVAENTPRGRCASPGTCEGDAVVGMLSCDGMGRCKPGATVICVPSSCNPSDGHLLRKVHDERPVRERTAMRERGAAAAA